MENKKSVYERLGLIQSKLAVAKDRTNDFGKFDYRNAEDIHKAAKPLALEQQCAIIMSEKLVTMNGQTYIKSTATLVAYDLSDHSMVTATAYAREATQKAGMDVSQITGSATSYARKYALGGLLAIDDGIDADGLDNREPAHDNCKKDRRPYQKNDVPRIDFAEVRKKLETINDVDDLENYWRELNPSNTQAKFLQRDFAKRKATINGVE